jgi:hypothetical protein
MKLASVARRNKVNEPDERGRPQASAVPTRDLKTCWVDSYII